MNTDKDYYIPKWNELRLGDWYDYYYSSRDKWEPDKFDGWDSACFKEDVEAQIVRVRYLSHNDILVEGWIERKDLDLTEGSYRIYEKGDWMLTYKPGSTYVEIDSDDSARSYYGDIKSLNQLRALCDMLGIENVQPQAPDYGKYVEPPLYKLTDTPSPDPHTIQHQPKEKWSGLKNVYRWLQGQ